MLATWVSHLSGIEPAGMLAFPMERSFSVLNRIKRALFAVLSRTGVWTYSRLPIFGALRAAVAIIRKDELVLVIARSDGRGLSFPGGFISPCETPEQAALREVFEETGLQVGKSSLLFEYRSSVDIPCVITVFEAEATGELHDSWEGSPRWLRLSEIRPLLLPNQREIVDRFAELKAP
jgi:8-oxo-dGTP pyrophosphatase MutT (NUDIX family)